MQKNLTAQNIGVLLITAFIWGSSFMLMKKGLLHLTAVQLACLRIFSACLVLFPFAVREFRLVEKNQWKYIFLVGFFGSGFPAFLFAYTQQFISSSTAGVLNSTTPLFTVLFGSLLFNTKSSNLRVLGIGLGFVGAVILILFGNKTSFHINLVAFLILIATACYGINTNIVKKYLLSVKPTVLNAFAFSFNAFWALWIFFLFTDYQPVFTHMDTNWFSLLCVFVLGALGSAYCNVLFFGLVQRTNPFFASTTTYLMPLFSSFWGFIDGEAIGVYYFIGMAFILVGVWLVSRF